VTIARVAEQMYSVYSDSALDEAALVELLSSPTDEVRWFAVERLRPNPRNAEAMLAAVPAARDDGETYVPELMLLMDEPLKPARRTAVLRGKVLGEMHRVAEDVRRPEAERAWMAQRLALLGGFGSISKAVTVLLGLSSGPTVLRALVDDPRRGTTCLEHLFHRREPAAREVLRDVLRTGSPRQREVVLARVPNVASAEDLPWIREALERRSTNAEAGAALSAWDGPLTAIERVGTLADVGLLYRLARTQHGAWAFALLGAVAHLQGRLGRIVELSEPTLYTPEPAPEEALARLLAEVHGTPTGLRMFVEQVVPELALELGWDRGVQPIARDLVELLDRHGVPSDFFLALESRAPQSADEVAALRERWDRRKPPP
jgi:hypothetical protein